MRLPSLMLLAALAACLGVPRAVLAGDCTNVISRAFTIAPPESLLPNRTALSRAFTIAPPESLLPNRTAVSRAFTIAPEGGLLPNHTAVSRAFTIAPPESLLPNRTAVSRAFTMNPLEGDACELQVELQAPTDGSIVSFGYPLLLSAEVSFGLPPYTVTWTSSRDGLLGTGESIQVSTLSAGGHTITVTAQDAAKRSAQDSADISVILAPDLVVQNLSAPMYGLAGELFGVSWTVANAGFAPAMGPWPDAVFISSDPVLSAGDTMLEPLQAPESLALAPGASYTSSITASWPAVPGEYWLFVRTDLNDDITEHSGEANNVAMVGPITIEAQPLPDLVVTNVTAPPDDIASGTPTSVTYTVQNLGAAATVAHWSDRVLLHGPGLPPGGHHLAQPGNPYLLLAGESYQRSASVTLPPDISGAFTIEVRADASGHMQEISEQNNTAGSAPFTIELEPQPDLQVLTIMVPPNASSGHPIGVQWTIHNAGEAETDSGSWRDAIYLSPDSDPAIGAGDILLTTTGPAGVPPLAQGASLVRNASPTIDISTSGTWYAKVVTDATNIISEAGFEENNVAASVSPIEIAQSFTPDLRPDTVQAFAPLPYPGHAFTVSWSAFNDGAPPLGPVSWSDALWLSPDAVLDTGDRFLGAFFASSAPDGTGGHIIHPYSRTRTPTIPADLTAGEWYVIVQIDSGDSVYEDNCDGPDCETNNVFVAAPFTVSSSFADLTVAITTPLATPVLAGSTVEVSWEVTNAGPIPTPVAQWHDRIWLSTDSAPGGGDVLLATVHHEGVLTAGASYQTATNVTIPAGTTGGSYFVLVDADSGDDVIEASGAEANVTTALIDVVALPSDPGAMEIEDQQQYADLTVTALTASAMITAGEPLAVMWTVANDAAAPPGSTVWSDRVWLSSDMTFGDDMLLGTRTRTGGLAPGTDYTVEASFATSVELTGTFFVLVQTDAFNNVLELDNTNNLAVSATATSITAAEAANLVVESVNVVGPAISGQPLEITWTVSNTGEATTSASSWNDSIYLSLNQFLEAGDIHLQTIASTCGALAIDATCARSASPVLPLSVNGLYFVLVQTNSNGAVYEAGRADDNVGVTTLLAQIVVPAPSDLQPGLFQPPAGPIFLGDDVELAWAVRNAGPGTVNGSWQDALFLSTDPVLSLEAVQIGTFGNAAPAGGLEIGEDALGSAPAAVPGTLPGMYWLLLRSDAFNNIPEVDESNNTGFSMGLVEVAARELPLGEPEEPMPVTGTLVPGRSRYYELLAPPGETVVISLQHDNPGAWTELFVSRDEVPTPGEFHFSGGEVGAAAQEIVIPSTERGSYFVLARAPALPPGPGDDTFTLLARRAPFDITAVHPPVVGAAQVTLTISGARFDGGSSFAIRHVASGTTFAPIAIFLDHAARARATFDLEGAPLGAYDVLGTSEMMEAELTEMLTVEAPSDFIVEHDMLDLVPARLGYTSEVLLSVRNTSNRDIANAMVALFTAENEALEWSFDGLAPPASNGEWRVKLVYIRQLPPDETYSFPITVNAGVSSGLDMLEYFPDVTVLSNAGFEERLQGLAERVREIVLAGQIVLSPQILDAAADAVTWWNLLRPVYVHAGYLDAGVLPPGAILDCTLLGEPLGMLDPGLLAAAEAACACGPDEICGCPAFPPCAGEGALDGGPRDGRELPCNLAVCFGAGDPIALEAGALNCGPGVACQELTLGVDPNEKDGEGGFGGQQWIGRATTQSYVIFFENMAEATAPVALVEVRDPLDEQINAASFRVGQITLGDVVVDVPPNRSTFTTRLNMTQSLGVLVDVFAGIDAATSPAEAFWILRAIDPMTGAAPLDGLAGFLPPNDGSGAGQGSVTFTVRPSLDAPHLSSIENDASVIFDANPPMPTTTVMNTLDAIAPVSSMAPLPPVVADPQIVLDVSGADVGEGSGLALISLLVSVDGGPLTPLAFTGGGEVHFTGSPGHVYGFTSQAVDYASNAEPMSAAPRVTTTVPQVRLAASSDSGIVGDGITNDTTPSFDVISAPLSDVLIEIMGPGVSIGGAAMTGADGRTTYTVSIEDALPDGTYVMMSTGFGVTVQASFAIDATPPAILAWGSAADHGSAGEVTLDVHTGGGTSEPRASGVSRLLLDLPGTGDAVESLLHDGATIEGTGIDGQPVDVSSIQIAVTPRPAQSRLELALSASLPDQALYCITVEGLRDPAGNLVDAAGARRQITALFGDASGDRRVNNTDVGGVLTLLGTGPIDPLMPYHVSSDVDTDGDIDEDDLDLVLDARGPDARFIPSSCGIMLVEGRNRFAALFSGEHMLSELDGPASHAVLSGGGLGGAGDLHGGTREDDLRIRDRTNPLAPWGATAPDPGGLALFDPQRGGAPMIDFDGEVIALPIAGWALLEGAGAAALETELLDTGYFVAPVLRTEIPGVRVIVTPSAFVALRPDVDREADTVLAALGAAPPVAVAADGDLLRIELPHRRGNDLLDALHEMAGSDVVEFLEPDVIVIGSDPLAMVLPRMHHRRDTLVAVLGDGISEDERGLDVVFRWAALDDAGTGPLSAGLARQLGKAPLASIQVAAPLGADRWVTRPSWIADGLDAARLCGATVAVSPFSPSVRSPMLARAYARAGDILHIPAAELVAPHPARPTDLDGDGDVDVQDVAVLLRCIAGERRPDMNRDGVVDILDVVDLIEQLDHAPMTRRSP